MTDDIWVICAGFSLIVLALYGIAAYGRYRDDEARRRSALQERVRLAQAAEAQRLMDERDARLEIRSGRN